MPSSFTTQLRRVAQAHALLTRQQLGVPTNQPVDVYQAVRSMRLWLMFQPMDGLFGMYQRYGTSAGMVLNVKVHAALQRYTAAHELGHHVLGHEIGIDPERHITGWTNLGQQETAAQMFASEFLMPLAAVNSEAKALGIQRDAVDELEIYQLSLRLRTSYAAMVTRLQTLEWIGASDARRFRTITPKSVKERLLGRQPDDTRADVWLVTDTEASPIQPLVGDSVVFEFPETPSTGFRWNPELPAGLSVTGDEFVDSDRPGEEVVGSPGRRRLRVSVDGPKSGHARFTLRRGWEPTMSGSEVSVDLASAPRPARGVDPVQLESGLSA